MNIIAMIYGDSINSRLPVPLIREIRLIYQVWIALVNKKISSVTLGVSKAGGRTGSPAVEILFPSRLR